MIDPPRLKPGWQPVLLDDCTVALLAEGQERLLRGELFRALVPLIDGEATFDAIFAAIDAAERYVLVQFFIVHDDRIGRAFRDRLIFANG